MIYCDDCEVMLEGEDTKFEDGEQICPYCSEPVRHINEDPEWR